MIAYFILHYNRPYFLDLNVQLIRKYLPKDTFIVLVDDGSLEPIVKSLKNKVDVVYHAPTHGSNTCCEILSYASRWVRKNHPDIDYVIFSEDDFLFWPSPISIRVEESKGESILNPEVDITLPELVEVGDPIGSSISILQNRKDIHLVQISRQIKNIHYRGSAGIPGWYVLDHKKIPKYYYNNWPFMMRASEFFDIKLPATGSVATLESSNCKWFNCRFGGTASYVAIPELPYYFHVGYPFSLQPIHERNARRVEAFQNLQKLVGSNLDPTQLNQILCGEYLKGNLTFSLEDIKKKGLQRVFQEKIARIS